MPAVISNIYRGLFFFVETVGSVLLGNISELDRKLQRYSCQGLLYSTDAWEQHVSSSSKASFLDPMTIGFGFYDN